MSKTKSKTNFDLNDQVMFIRKTTITRSFGSQPPEYTLGRVISKQLSRHGNRILCRVQWENGYKRDYYQTSLTCPSDANISDAELIDMMNKKLLDELKVISVNSLSYPMEFGDHSVKVGCQRITRTDALKLAERINLAYAE